MKKTTNGTANGTGTPAPSATARLGDVVVALFDEAQRMTKDPRRAARLAATALTQMLTAARAQRATRLLASEI
jgi:hypothetical protein